MTTSSGQPVLLYDGLCGFCDRVVQFVLARDRRGTLRFAPVQGEFARGVIVRHARLRGIDSLVYVEGNPERAEVARARSDAVIAIGLYLGGGWKVLATMLRVVPRFIRDYGYDVLARFRYRVFGRYDSCPLPSAEQTARFIL